MNLKNLNYDVIICGGGTAGLSAAIYCGRYGLNTLLLEKVVIGGQAVRISHIENYPGIPDIAGFELIQNLESQAKSSGANLKTEEIAGYDFTGDVKKILCADLVYESKAVILAPGARPRELGLPNESGLVGSGVSYCAECDGFFYRGKTVCVVGGGDTAVQDALYLSTLCKKVYLIHRRDSFRAEKIGVKRLYERENVEFILNGKITEITENGTVSGVKIVSTASGASDKIKTISLDGVFVAVGTEPNTSDLSGHIALTESGHIPVNAAMRTNIPGVFAAGDAVQKDLHQLITAAADGALAAYSVNRYITMEI